MSELIFANYSMFKSFTSRFRDLDREYAANQATELLEKWSDRVETRGVYSTGAFTAQAHLMFWWIARSPDDLQGILTDFLRTQLGRALYSTETFMGLVRPAEFSPEHVPAFAAGKPPKRFACVYPFVRTPEWYLLEPDVRSKLLREHGEAAREFPDVLANTTSGFGLGDYEWILCFEADGVELIVDLIRRLRATEARRYTKVETPFFTGIRKELHAAVEDLP